MDLYQYFDFLIESNIPLLELPRVQTGIPELKCYFHAGVADTDNLDWFYHWRQPDGEILISCAQDSHGYSLRFPKIADFRIEVGNRTIKCYYRTDSNTEMIRHLLLDQVIPRVTGLSGKIVLHASAICMDGHAIIFPGTAGTGKSTLSASYYKRGGHMLADDCLMLDFRDTGIYCIPNYPGLRLWQDSFAAITGAEQDIMEMPCNPFKKRMICRNSASRETVPVAAIVALAQPENNDGGISITRITGAGAIMELLKHSFTLDRDKTGVKFLAKARVASAVPIYRLSYPRKFAFLHKVHDTIYDEIIGSSYQAGLSA